jgi:hypothetical protein
MCIDNTIMGAIIGVVGTIIGIFIGSYITYRHSIKLNKIQNFNNAVTEFKNAFTDDIRIFMDRDPKIEWSSQTTRDVLDYNYIKHENAIIKFSHFLSGKELTEFKKAWKSFRCEETKKVQPHDYFICYISLVGKPEDELKKRKLALKRINKMFDFAKFK